MILQKKKKGLRYSTSALTFFSCPRGNLSCSHAKNIKLVIKKYVKHLTTQENSTVLHYGT